MRSGEGQKNVRNLDISGDWWRLVRASVEAHRRFFFPPLRPLGVLSQQVFAWHHLKVVTVIGGAMLTIGLCILYKKYIKERC